MSKFSGYAEWKGKGFYAGEEIPVNARNEKEAKSKIRKMLKSSYEPGGHLVSVSRCYKRKSI